MSAVQRWATSVPQGVVDHSVLAEMALIGAAMGSEEGLAVLQNLSPNDFGDIRCRKYFFAIMRLVEMQTQIEPASVFTELVACQEATQAGGEPFLGDLVGAAAFDSQLDHYAEELTRLSRTRVEGPPPGASHSLEPMAFLSWDELTAMYDKPTTWLIEGILKESGFTLIQARWKSGKTTLLLWIVGSLITGQPLLGRFNTIRPVNVRIFVGEGRVDEFISKLRLVVVKLGGDESLIRERVGINVEPRRIDSPEFKETIRRMIADGEKEEFVVLMDPFFAYVPDGYDMRDLYKSATTRLEHFHRPLAQAGISSIMTDHARKTGTGDDAAIGVGSIETADVWIQLERENDSRADLIRSRLHIQGRSLRTETWTAKFSTPVYSVSDGRFVGEMGFAELEPVVQQQGRSYDWEAEKRTQMIVELNRVAPWHYSKTTLARAVGGRTERVRALIEVMAGEGDIASNGMRLAAPDIQSDLVPTQGTRRNSSTDISDSHSVSEVPPKGTSGEPPQDG